MGYHRDRCRTKRRYASRGEAWAAKQEMFGRGAARKAAGLKAYRCPFGEEHYHLGHPPKLETLQQLAAEIRGLEDA